MFLKFPSILAGEGSVASWIVLAAIVLLVVGVLVFVFRRLAD